MANHVDLGLIMVHSFGDSLVLKYLNSPSPAPPELVLVFVLWTIPLDDEYHPQNKKSLWTLSTPSISIFNH